MIRTAYQPAAEFESSNDLLNRIYRTTTWTYENLTLGGYVVDCPTRERLGYGGDAGTSLETGMFNFDTSALYTEVALQLARRAAAQRRPALYRSRLSRTGRRRPHVERLHRDPALAVVPAIRRPADPGDLLPLHAAMAFLRGEQDRRPRARALRQLRDHSAAVELSGRLGHAHAATATPPATRRARGFINTIHYLYQLQIASRIAGVLGRKEESSQYGAKAEALARGLHQRFFDPSTGVYVKGEQAYQAMPLLVRHGSARPARGGHEEPGERHPGQEQRPRRYRHARHLFPAQTTDGGGPQRSHLCLHQQDRLPELGQHARAGRHHHVGELVGRLAHSRHPDLHRRVVHPGHRRHPHRREIARLHPLLHQAGRGRRPDVRPNLLQLHPRQNRQQLAQRKRTRSTWMSPFRLGTTATVLVPAEAGRTEHHGRIGQPPVHCEAAAKPRSACCRPSGRRGHTECPPGSAPAASGSSRS